MEKKRRVPRYLIGILILLVVNAILISLALGWIYRSLEAFEATTPTTALDRYFAELDDENFTRIDAESGFEPSALDSMDDYHRYLRALYGADLEGLEYRRASAESAPKGAQVYAVYRGGEQFGEVYLYEGQGEGGGWRVCAPVALGESYTITAPGHATVLVNGTPQDPSTATASQPLEMFGELPEGSPVPVILTYSVPASLFPPTFAATGPEGTTCEVAVDEAAHTVAVAVELPEETIAEYAAQMEAVAKVYSTFISEDVPFTTLAPHLIEGTDFYERMRTYYVGWYIDHDSYAFLNMETMDITSVSETCFTGEIKFTFEVYRGAKVNTFPTHYRMAFTQIDGTWKLLELKVF